MFKTLLYSFTN